jgi:hypothetical protein
MWDTLLKEEKLNLTSHIPHLPGTHKKQNPHFTFGQLLGIPFLPVHI